MNEIAASKPLVTPPLKAEELRSMDNRVHPGMFRHSLNHKTNNEIKDLHRQVQLRKSQRMSTYVNARERSGNERLVEEMKDKFSRSSKLPKHKSKSLLSQDDDPNEPRIDLKQLEG